MPVVEDHPAKQCPPLRTAIAPAIASGKAVKSTAGTEILPSRTA
jgi:hypothetical protein